MMRLSVGSGRLLRCRHVACNIHYRVVGENAPAAFTEHDLVAAAQILKELWAKRNLAGGAAAFCRVRDWSIPGLLADALIFRIEPGLHLIRDAFSFAA